MVKIKKSDKNSYEYLFDDLYEIKINKSKFSKYLDKIESLIEDGIILPSKNRNYSIEHLLNLIVKKDRYLNCNFMINSSCIPFNNTSIELSINSQMDRNHV